MKPALFLAAICTVGVACSAQELDVEELLVQPEPAIQSSIEKVANALNRNNVEARQLAADVLDANADKREIVTQVAIFAAGPDEQQPLMALAVLQLLDLPPNVIIEALAPYLNVDDVKVRSFVRDWFQGHDNAGSDESKLKPINFEDYADYVRKRKEDIPNAFVEYLFERSPGRAFLVFVGTIPKSEAVKKLQAMREELEQQRPGGLDGLPQPRAGDGIEQNELLLAEHVISNTIWLRKYYFQDRFPEALPEAKRQLTMLAEREQWWARLYVAMIMKRHRELRQAEVLEKLSQDSKELVSETEKSSLE
jgi:hypothetical protein